MTENYLRVLKADPTQWLLEADNPSVRYFALTELLGEPQSRPSVKKSKRDIMRVGAVPLILFKQQPEGYWESAEHFYVGTKYKGTVWQLIVLAELGVDGEDPRIQKACEFVLAWSQDQESGGFAYRGSAGGGLRAGVIPCLTGSMVWSLIRFGYLDDIRVRKAIELMMTYQRTDDADKRAPSAWPYERFEQCWGKHSCHMGVVRTLKALAEVPPHRRSQSMKAVIELGAEYLLKHHLYKRSHDLSQVAKPAWLKFGFPLMWNTDALDMLGLIVKLGFRDERLRDAVDLVISKQDGNGMWSLETTFNGRFQVNIERKGRPSKWVTLNALRALKGFLD